MTNKRVMLFDPSIRETPSIPNHNLGDLVIRDAISKELNYLLSKSEVDRVSTQLPISLKDKLRANKADHRIVCGTNLLSSKHKKYTPWKITRFDTMILKPVTLCGVGWWSDQSEPDDFTAAQYKRILSKNGLHSVRDRMTKDRLNAIGIQNVVNTSCPTLWQIEGLSQDDLPAPKHEAVLTTLSFWRKNPELDRRFVELLKKYYRQVYIFPQGNKDTQYIEELNLEINLINYSYDEFGNFFSQHPDAEYIGLRLHAGIRCLQQKIRSLIVEVDNRAREISNDTGLPTVAREDFEAIESWIQNGKDFQIKLNRDAIDQYLQQFRCD